MASSGLRPLSARAAVNLAKSADPRYPDGGAIYHLDADPGTGCVCRQAPGSTGCALGPTAGRQPSRPADVLPPLTIKPPSYVRCPVPTANCCRLAGAPRHPHRAVEGAGHLGALELGRPGTPQQVGVAGSAPRSPRDRADRVRKTDFFGASAPAGAKARNEAESDMANRKALGAQPAMTMFQRTAQHRFRRTTLGRTGRRFSPHRPQRCGSGPRQPNRRPSSAAASSRSDIAFSSRPSSTAESEHRRSLAWSPDRRRGDEVGRSRCCRRSGPFRRASIRRFCPGLEDHAITSARQCPTTARSKGSTNEPMPVTRVDWIVARRSEGVPRSPPSRRPKACDELMRAWELQPRIAPVVLRTWQCVDRAQRACDRRQSNRSGGRYRAHRGSRMPIGTDLDDTDWRGAGSFHAPARSSRPRGQSGLRGADPMPSRRGEDRAHHLRTP